MLTSIFRRKGRAGRHTRLFEDLEPLQKSTLQDAVKLDDNELPVIGSVESRHKWLVLTTERVVWHFEGKTQTLSVWDIRDVEVDLQALASKGIHKDQMRELQINTMGGEQFTIEVEEGAPLIGVWNALKNLGARNRRHKPN
ncbi:MAG: hypothetical protein ACREBG_01145 [Pyrinomonadaceae bacterium]